MRKTTHAFAAAMLLGGLTLGAGAASAACSGDQAGLRTGDVPTSYVMMKKKQMKKPMMGGRMMKNKPMMKKKMM